MNCIFFWQRSNLIWQILFSSFGKYCFVFFFIWKILSRVVFRVRWAYLVDIFRTLNSHYF